MPQGYYNSLPATTIEGYLAGLRLAVDAKNHTLITGAECLELTPSPNLDARTHGVGGSSFSRRWSAIHL